MAIITRVDIKVLRFYPFLRHH